MLYNYLKKNNVPQKPLVVVGNVVEFFDLYLFIHCATVIQEKLLPLLSGDWMRNFGIAGYFLCVPASIIVWGYVGDKYGRRAVLLGSITLTSLCCVSLFVLTFFHDFSEHLFFACLIIITRIFQLFGMGGEPISAKLYAAEDNEKDPSKIPFWTEMMTVAQNAGMLIALGLGIVFCTTNRNEFLFMGMQYWQVPFLVSAVLCFFVLVLRSYVYETQEYKFHSDITHPESNYAANQVAQIRAGTRNFLVFTYLTAAVPLMFMQTFTLITHKVLERCGAYSTEGVMWHNLKITALVCIFSFTVTCATVFLKLNRRRVQYCLFCFGFVMCFVLEHVELKKENLTLYAVLQALMLLGVAWNIMYGHVLKSLPVMRRFRQVAWSEVLAKCFFVGPLIFGGFSYFATGREIEAFLFLSKFLIVGCIIAIFCFKEVLLGSGVVCQKTT